jgi:hypothetical protein
MLECSPRDCNILIEFSCGFPYCHHTNAGMDLKMTMMASFHIPSNSSLLIILCDTV